MNSLLMNRFGINFRSKATESCRKTGRKFSAGSGHNTVPHVPEFHDRLGRGILIVTFLWIFYRAKENNGNIFGYNLPWHQAHEEHVHLAFEVAGDHGDAMPTEAEAEEHSEDDEEEEEEE